MSIIKKKKRGKWWELEIKKISICLIYLLIDQYQTIKTHKVNSDRKRNTILNPNPKKIYNYRILKTSKD
jgi:hypothetical protein